MNALVHEPKVRVRLLRNAALRSQGDAARRLRDGMHEVSRTLGVRVGT